MSLALLALFIIIQAADVWTTLRAIALGGEEANPFASGAFARLGFWGSTALIKGGAIALAAAATLLVSNGWIFVAVLTLIGLAVLVNNLRVLTSLR